MFLYSDLALIEKFLEEIVDNLSVDTSHCNYDAQPNKTTNDFGSIEKSEFFKQKAYHLINQSLICGYKNAESNVEDLNLPFYEKYFAIPSFVDNEEQEKTNREMQKKSVILYGLYVLKQKSSDSKNQSFVEYMRKVLSED